MENVKHCQSCGVPINGEMEVTFGKNADGSPNEDYCNYCFPNGEFDDWDGTVKTMEDMVNACIPHMVESGMFDEVGARAMLEEMLPTLKRWKSA